MYDTWAITYSGGGVYALHYINSTVEPEVPKTFAMKENLDIVGYLSQHETTGAVEKSVFIDDFHSEQFFRQRK